MTIRFVQVLTSGGATQNGASGDKGLIGAHIVVDANADLQTAGCRSDLTGKVLYKFDCFQAQELRHDSGGTLMHTLTLMRTATLQTTTTMIIMTCNNSPHIDEINTDHDIVRHDDHKLTTRLQATAAAAYNKHFVTM